jgi:hypothetical protein
MPTRAFHKGALEQASLHPAKLYRVPSLYHAFAAVKQSDCVLNQPSVIFKNKLVGKYLMAVTVARRPQLIIFQ